MSLQANKLDLFCKYFCWVFTLMRVISPPAPSGEGAGGGEEGRACSI